MGAPNAPTQKSFTDFDTYMSDTEMYGYIKLLNLTARFKVIVVCLCSMQFSYFYIFLENFIMQQLAN